ncbi:MAG: tRNA uridine-5-carboxymethylaminomethyl(34) synthesis enzyme MnmG, partial [Phycisphaerales bacterium]
EAAWAAAGALGPDATVVLVTMDPTRVGAMSCNPAIGGLAKGQMVREIDALGGLMGLAADVTGIQFKMLNQSKGAAVRGPRAQCDKHRYALEVQRLLSTRPQIRTVAGTVDALLVERGVCVGVRVSVGAGAGGGAGAGVARAEGGSRAAGGAAGAAAGGGGAADVLDIHAGAVVLTTGTFMRALMHTGTQQTPGGRVGEGSAVGISAALRDLGFQLGRLKTGTPPRLERSTIAWDTLEPQHGDAQPTPFSDLPPAALPGGRFPHLQQVECRLTRTTPEIHALIRQNLHLAPMYSGQIEAECGPRYCPSLEDKVVRFADKEQHQVFLEPEGLDTSEIYCNGISTSLPAAVQEHIVRGMPGCQDARIIRWGYAVEYDMVWPHQIDATTETKLVEGLFLAGQINGTSGYEEAAAQGLLSGLNAARRVRGLPAVRLGRAQAYIGVMMDDLVTRTPREPYRMFTSRAEHRLLLRADNADERLTPLGRELGLVDSARWAAWEARREALAGVRAAIAETRVGASAGARLADLARRPDVSVEEVWRLLGRAHPLPLVDRVVTDMRYAGYVERQRAEIRRQEASEHVAIPAALEPDSITGLRHEAREALRRFRPSTLGQAGRLAGISPADVTLIALAVRRSRG